MDLTELENLEHGDFMGDWNDGVEQPEKAPVRPPIQVRRRTPASGGPPEAVGVASDSGFLPGSNKESLPIIQGTTG